MLRTFSKSVWSQLQPAEWVCLGFVVLSALRVLTTSSPLGAGVTSWMQFPRLDLMAAAFAVLTLKLTRKNRPVTILILVTLVACFFGIAGISADAVLPIPHALGPTIFNTLAAIRWWLLAALAGVFALTISKNPDSRATALDGLRAIFPLFLMTCLYPLAPILIRAAGAPDRDAQLQWLDSAIFLGHDPLLIAERWISPALSEWMTLSYTAYGLIFLAVSGLFGGASGGGKKP
ncbi:MAG: hypothetical protein ACXWPM_02865 [Bdellovibrionota bacterium]